MYQPSKEILDKYADVLINFALGGGKGVQKSEVVLLQVQECAKPLLIALRNAVLKAGAHPIVQFIPDGIMKEAFELSNDEQVSFFPEKFMRGRIDQIDHCVSIIADIDKQELKGIDPKKIMARSLAFKPYKDWTNKKENSGKYTWTLAAYGTPQMAKAAKMELEDYWNQIILACYLDEKDPKEKWKHIQAQINDVIHKLNQMNIEKVRIEAEKTDLFVRIGKKRNWTCCSGRNIPSFEILTSPDWRGTEGHIKFTEPLYVYGNLVKDVYLEFKEGIVVKATASVGEELLKEMIATLNANKVGEFSMTDGRVSRITKFMGETLFDENVGGEQGNVHIALGNAYQDCYRGNQRWVSNSRWDKLGFNNSAVHTDIVATSKRRVTAYPFSGKPKIIYENGIFVL
jgi:aminopeptidase